MQLFLYPRRESNPKLRNRNPLFYPLNYRGLIDIAKLMIFSVTISIFVVKLGY